jgi:hypothetical protein
VRAVGADGSEEFAAERDRIAEHARRSAGHLQDLRVEILRASSADALRMTVSYCGKLLGWCDLLHGSGKELGDPGGVRRRTVLLIVLQASRPSDTVGM